MEESPNDPLPGERKEGRMSNQVDIQNESAVDENTEMVISTANVQENERYVCPALSHSISSAAFFIMRSTFLFRMLTPKWDFDFVLLG